MRTEPGTTRRQWLWFLLMWAGGVAAMLVLSLLFRGVLRALGAA